MIFGLDLAVFQRIILTPERNVAIANFIARFPEHTENLTRFFNNLQGLLPIATYIFNGVLIILVVMFYPGGLYQLTVTLKQKIDKKIKQVKHDWMVRRYGQDA
ncbi:MAG: hypothetical protein MZU97_24245 [Bacillus subtilis]|nr:hypothetical protein [Bacillus subtilis]